MSTQLTDSDLARLEVLASPYANAPAWKIEDTQNICTRATPALVAEVRRLRDRVEALEWIVECIDNYEWNSSRSGWFIAQGVAKEAKATMQTAREAMK